MTCPACGEEMKLLSVGGGSEHWRCSRPECLCEFIDECTEWTEEQQAAYEKLRAVSATKLEFVREEVIGGKVFKYYESGSGRAFVIEEKPAYVEREDGMGLLSYLNEDRPEYSVSVG